MYDYMNIHHIGQQIGERHVDGFILFLSRVYLREEHILDGPKWVTEARHLGPLTTSVSTDCAVSFVSLTLDGF